MLYNLRNGSTISISTDRFLDMSDEDFEKLELYYSGAEINNPFFGSVLQCKQEKEAPQVSELDISTEDIIEDEEIEEE